MSIHAALKWLIDHNGDGAFCVGGKGGALLAAGETAPFTRSTWNKLRDAKLVQFYGGSAGAMRCRITDAGKRVAGMS